MELEPYQIPISFQSYLEQFETDPEGAITRLEKHVSKRNTGAVGYFFLAWFYHKNDNGEKAADAAWKAKIHAPGSRVLGRLPYFLVHPSSFEAWEPDPEREPFKRGHLRQNESHPIQDLDQLISKLSSVETKRIRFDPSSTGQKQPDLSENSSQVDDIVTETLAVIHEKQKNYPAAIETYQKLLAANPGKKDHFEKQISRLRKKLEGDKE